MDAWLVQPDLNRLSGSDHAVMLEPRVMAVLVCLARQPGRIVRAGELLDTVWRGRAHADNTIYQAVADLRKALDDDVHDPRYIETIAKKGYRLICPVTPAAADSETFEIPLHSPNGRRYRRRNLAIFAGVASIAVAIVLTANMELWNRVLQMDEGPRERSVAVLPFVDMSEDRSQQYLGDGISEELIHVLSNVPDLRVIARTSSFVFRDSDADIRQIGRQLNVATVLEGSVRKDGDRIRITSQLVDTRDGYHLWSKSFERRATDLFGIQDEIAVAVAKLFEYRELDAFHADDHVVRTDDLQAYDFYLLGLHKLRMNRRGPKRAAQHFERAIEMDPGFARAYAGLSESYANRYWYEEDQALLDKAESAAEFALQLDDQSAEGFAAMGFVKAVKQDFAGAEAAYRKAVVLNPNDGHAYMYLAFNIARQDRQEEALVMVMSALELDPMSGRLNHWMGRYYNAMPHRDWDAAYIYFKRAMDREPDFAWSYRDVGVHYQSIGRIDEAIPYFRKVVDLTAGPTENGLYVELLADTYVDIGDYTSAEQVIRRTREFEPQHIGASNSDIHLQLARNDFAAARDIVHRMLPRHIDKDGIVSLMAFYEMVIGDTDHAEDIYIRLAARPDSPDVNGDVNLYKSNELSWGMLGAVNLAYLHKSNGDAHAVKDLLGRARVYIESRGDFLSNVGNSLYVLAQIAVVEENNDAAIDYLREAVDAGWTRAWFGRIDPIMTHLRKDARFMQILEKLEGELMEMRENPRTLASIES